MNTISWLEELAGRYRTQQFVLEGITPQAHSQNLEWLKTIQKAGEALNQIYHNQVYGILVKGSRIKGYHGIESDIDVVIVSPEHAGSQRKFWDVISGVCETEGVSIKFDTLVGLWDNSLLYADADRFISVVDNDPGFLNCLLGHQAYANPNLLMARLAALEVVCAYNGRYDWKRVQKRYNEDYLMTPENDFPKIAKRFGINPRDVGKIITREVYQERCRKFTLPSPKLLQDTLQKEYSALDKKELQKYEMYGILESVKKKIKEGY
jgi:predicted nucleotidyltransferase